LLFGTPLDLTAEPGKTVWGGTGAALGAAVIVKAVEAKQAAQTASALRLADGPTLLSVASQRLAGTPLATVSPRQDVQLVVEASGHGRVECFVATQEGADVTYVGTIAPYAGSGRVQRPLALSGNNKDSKILFQLKSGEGAVTLLVTYIGVSSSLGGRLDVKSS